MCSSTRAMENKKSECPYASANIFSKATIWWMNSYFKKGTKKKLVSENLYQIADEHRSDYLTKKLSRYWNEECSKAVLQGRKPSFKIAFWKTFMSPFMLNALLLILTECLRTANPFLIGEISNYFVNPSDTPLWYPYVCAACLTCASLAGIFVETLHFTNLKILGWNAKSAVVGLMYEKTLKLSNKALMETSRGKIVNLSSTDALRYDLTFLVAHYLWLAPLECGIFAYILFLRLGAAAFIGMLVLFVIMGVQSLLGIAFEKMRLLIAAATDERIQATNELIASMRIVKMYSWEKSFQELIDGLRNKEMRKVFCDSLLRSVNFATNHATNLILSFATFVAFVLLNGDLDLQVVVVSLGLFLILLLGAGLAFPWAIENLFETFAVIKRTEEFLLLPEQASISISVSNDPAVELYDYSASWSEGNSFSLQNISVEVKKGELLMVIGPVGSGKSSLVSAILGELAASSGRISIDGNIGYTSQLPWLFSGTIRENIIFGQFYDSERFQQVIQACALDQDIKSFPQKESSVVGERGVTLSGGQKARVSLARLLYCSDVDIAVMDDPLSAVDASVANHLFEECICGLLENKVKKVMSGITMSPIRYRHMSKIHSGLHGVKLIKIRILVTHQLQFLEKADKILILEKGRIVDYGTYQGLLQKGIDFGSLIKVANNDNSDAKERLEKRNSYQFNDFELDDENSFQQDDIEAEMDHLIKRSEDNMEEDYDEDEDPRSISWKVYKTYLIGNLPCCAFFFLFIIISCSHVLFILSDWWLARWAVASETHVAKRESLNASLNLPASMMAGGNVTVTTQNNFVPDIAESFDHFFYLNVYAGLTIGFFVSMYIRTAMHYYVCIQSSINLHAKMLAAVLKTNIRFFDTNPVGAILNRFSKDMNQVDESLPVILFDVFFYFGVVVSIVIFVVIINYFVLIIIIPIAVYLVWLRKYFVATSREIKRIEGQGQQDDCEVTVKPSSHPELCVVDRSPVFSHLSASLEGIVTIRSFRQQEDFSRIYHDLQDIHGASWSAHFFGTSWLGCRLDMAVATFIGASAFFSVLLVTILPDDWPIHAGNLGLTLTYATSLIVWFQWGVQQSAEGENMMTSVERICDYHKLPEETNNAVGKSPPPAWPESGAVSFTNVSFAYFEDGPSILKDVNLEINPKEKLGIVGRTGAGKSSIVAALFRLSDQISGSIKIDGMETNEVDLQRWRSVLTVIPQDPVLFGRSMRKNLDPFSDHTDPQLWNALEKVRLKDYVETLPSKLETVVAESGSNLSVGQRQLLCLARAILRENKILIIDEATANVDNNTDRLIQETIRKEFNRCTVITIAHRLDTVINSDRILVLDEGKILECDEPYNLLQDSSSALSKLLRKSRGRERELREIAEQLHERKTNARHLDDGDQQ